MYEYEAKISQFFVWVLQATRWRPSVIMSYGFA